MQIVLNCDCRDVDLETIAECGAMITDPPYRAHVHRSAVSAGGPKGTRRRDLGFRSLAPELRRWTARAASAVQRWSVIYTDVESATWWRISAETAGASYIRTIPWVRWSMPQLSGDRPTTGQEKLVILHREEPEDRAEDLIVTHGAATGKKHWNGPGNLTHLQHKCLRGENKHKTEKPLDQALDLVAWFSDPGECIFDPFAGSGVIGLACKLLGRRYLGCELDPAWAEAAARRASGECLDRDHERFDRWLASDPGNAAMLASQATDVRQAS